MPSKTFFQVAAVALIGGGALTLLINVVLTRRYPTMFPWPQPPLQRTKTKQATRCRLEAQITVAKAVTSPLPLRFHGGR